MNKTDSIAFNRRYFVIGVLAYILSAYIALDGEKYFANINTFTFGLYTGVFTLVVVFVYLIIRICLNKNREAAALCSASFVVILIFIFGFFHCITYVKGINSLTELINQSDFVEGIVCEEVEESNSGKSYRLVVDVHKAHIKTKVIEAEKQCKVQFFISKDKLESVPSAGDSILCYNQPMENRKAAYEGGYDSLKVWRQSDIVYSAYIYKAEGIADLKDKYPMFSSFKEMGFKIRKAVLNSTELGDYSKDEKALLQGILVGETLGFSDELYEKYKASGFIHIASVSGMHTSYLFLLISFILGMMRFPRRTVCFIAIPVLVMFSAVALFEASVCRAVIMMIVMLMATIIKRRHDGITALSIAALLLSIENPYCLHSYSFLLSFGATLGILVYYIPFRNRLSFCVMKEKKLKSDGFFKWTAYKVNSFSVQSVCLSLGGTIGLGYFMMRFYGTLQWGSIIGNIFMFPLTAVSFIGGYINCIMYYICMPAAELMAGFILNPCLYLANCLAEFFSARIFRFDMPYLSKTFFVVYIFICVIIYHWLMPTRKK